MPSGSESVTPTLDIVIPAHNEEMRLGDTLGSISRAIQRLERNSRSASRMPVSVRIGADACADSTATVAMRFDRASVTTFNNGSKWKTLKALCASSRAEWVIVVDAGTVWPEDFLLRLLSRLTDNPPAMGLAPAYRPLRAGLLPHSIWRFETLLKRIEARAGGPISLHGATIAYKTRELQAAFEMLGETVWLNDDIVLPLALRALYPEKRIIYPVGYVHDIGADARRLDVGRRKRMAAGNIQWIRLLWPKYARLNPVAGVLALRRIFRLVWAYWLASALMATAMIFPRAIVPAALAAVGSLIVSGSVRQLAGAAWISFCVPFQILVPAWAEVSWK
ncbi:MAG TPA: glycosyltransferase [Elusimicrobiota bacterium]|nr:glycosyltransferase [Elusimicrobiota bacterium]